MEAAKTSNSIRVSIGLIDNNLFDSLFNSCKRLGGHADNFVDYQTMDSYFCKRFDLVLGQLFQAIIVCLDRLDPENIGNEGEIIDISLPKYATSVSSLSSLDDITCTSSSPSLHEYYQEMISAANKFNRLLVIHLDDCQAFFCGLTKNQVIRRDGKVRFSDVMSSAFRIFSRRVSSMPHCKDVLWIFSGTRPNLDLEMKIASSFGNVFNIAKTLRDFESTDIAVILGSYYQLRDASDELKGMFGNLSGPPKHTFWFLAAAQSHALSSTSDLQSKWGKIESEAIGRYREQIESTIGAFGISPDRLEIISRNLCLIHTQTFMNYQFGEFLEFQTLPESWMPFIEAGLIRVFKNDVWKLYPANRFLVKIFNRTVKWFTWQNILSCCNQGIRLDDNFERENLRILVCVGTLHVAEFIAMAKSEIANEFGA